MTRGAGRRALSRFVVLVYVCSLLLPATAGAVGSCGVFRTWATGDSLTASDLNSSFTQAATTNSTPQCLDDYSANAAQMNTDTDPNSAGSGSLATATSGEFERLRFVLRHLTGHTQWWTHYEDINFGSRMVRTHQTANTSFKSVFSGWTGLDNSATRFHVFAIGVYTAAAHPESLWLLFHTNGTTNLAVSIGGDVHASGSVAAADGSLQHPTFNARNDQKSGVYFPANAQVGVNIDRNLIGRWHGAGLVLANHAGVYLAHAGTSLHINGMSLRTNAIMYGSADSAFRIQGANGLSETADGLISVASSGTGLSTKAISGRGVVVTHTATTITLSGSTGLFGSRGQFSTTGSAANANSSFTLRAHSVALMHIVNHTIAVVHSPAATTVNIETSGPTANGGRDQAAAFSASSWVHFYWIYDGSTISAMASASPPSAGPNFTTLTGYMWWSYAGAVRLDSTSALVPTHIMGSMAYYHTMVRALSAGTATSETTVDLATAVPPNATEWLGDYQINSSANNANLRLRYLSGVDFWRKNLAEAQASVVFTLSMPMVSQRMYYLFDTANSGATISVIGYRVPNGG